MDYIMLRIKSSFLKILINLQEICNVLRWKYEDREGRDSIYHIKVSGKSLRLYY